jgi:hypothetical protein
MPKKIDPEAVRHARVRQLWEARSPKERTATDVVIFHGWLQEHFPELLPRGKGDSYQHLKVDLQGLIMPQTEPDEEESK